MEDKLYGIFAICIVVFMIVAYFVRLFCKKKRYKNCPICHRKTKPHWHSTEKDASKRPVRMGSKFIFGGKVISYRLTIYCKHCGFERDI